MVQGVQFFVVYPKRVIWDVLGLLIALCGAQALFSYQSYLGGELVHLEIPWGPRESLNVFYQCSLPLVNVLGRFRASQCIIREACHFLPAELCFGQSWGAHFEWLKRAFFGVRPEFAPIFLEQNYPYFQYLLTKWPKSIALTCTFEKCVKFGHFKE